MTTRSLCISLLFAVQCLTSRAAAEPVAEADESFDAFHLASVPLPGSADELVVDEEHALELFLSPSDFPGALVRLVLRGAEADFAVNLDLSSLRGEAVVERVSWPTLGGRALEVAAPPGGVTLAPVEGASGGEALIDQELQLSWFLRPEEGEEGLRGRVHAVRLSTVEPDQTLAVWIAPPAPSGCHETVEAGQPRCRAAGVSRAIRQLSIDSSGRWVAVAGGDLRPRVDLWQRSSFALSRWITFPPWLGPPLGAEYTADGRLLVVADGAGSLHLWDAATGGGHRQIDAEAQAFAVLDSGQRVVVAGAEGGVTLWRTRDGTIESTLGRRGEVRTLLAPSADGLRLAALGEDDLLIWEVEDSRLVGRVGGVEAGIVAMQLDGGGDHVVVSHDRRGLLRAAVEPGGAWSPFGGELGRRCRGALATNLDRSILACALDQGVALFDLERGRALVTLGDGGVGLDALAFSPDGAALVATGAGELLEWLIPASSPDGAER